MQVQFDSAAQTQIIAFFGSPQSPDSHENLGEVETSDARWKTYFDSLSDFAKQGLPPPTVA